MSGRARLLHRYGDVGTAPGSQRLALSFCAVGHDRRAVCTRFLRQCTIDALPMIPKLLNVSLVISTLVAAMSVMYCFLCIWAAARFASQRKQAPVQANNLPSVSILKPLKGTDPEIYASLRSHCLQHYPGYEILFGVTNPDDPAIPVIEKLIEEFPDRAIRLVRCDKKLGANGKVSSLAQLAAVAAHDFFLVNDSDIRVEPGYLLQVMCELQAPETGLVTCLYRGVAAHTMASRLESLSIGTDFMPGVLAARQIEGGLRFGLGSTLAFRRRDLRAIGGFEAIVDYLADDYELGRRIAERNLKVTLSVSVVETYLPAYTLAGFVSHQLRWARTIRASRPSGYAGLLFTFTLPWAALTLIIARGASWAWGLLAVALAVRMAMALFSARWVLRDRQFGRWSWLLPVRDFLAVLLWLGGLAGHKIVWRGEVFALRDGKLTRSS
jgi:ceramide glucosyltransferase